jgi:hypothetical protein
MLCENQRSASANLFIFASAADEPKPAEMAKPGANEVLEFSMKCWSFNEVLICSIIYFDFQ